MNEDSHTGPGTQPLPRGSGPAALQLDPAYGRRVHMGTGPRSPQRVHMGMGLRSAEPGLSCVCVHTGGWLLTPTTKVFWVRPGEKLEPGPAALVSRLEGTWHVCSSHGTHTAQSDTWT